MGKLVLFVALSLFFACTSSESVDEFYKAQKKEKARKQTPSKAIDLKTAVPTGTKVPCEKLMDVAQMTELLGEKHPISFFDRSKRDFEATSVCSVRRGGKMMGKKAQEKKVKETLMLGVLAGDELCNVAAYCSIPTNEKQLQKKCKQEKMQSNEEIGVFACVKVTPKGPHDAFTYRFIDPETQCVVRVRGGPSVNEEAQVQKCAKAALFLIERESLVP